MASIFGHVVASTALGAAFFPKQFRAATVIVAGICAFIPDADVLGFHFGIPYGSIWGHRGWTHSLVFAAIFGWLMAGTLPAVTQNDRRKMALWLVISTASHPLLDMLTNGGKGVALFFPFDNSRLFFPFRPIQVSPIGISNFFSSWGAAVLASEAVWIGIPGVLLVLLAKALRSTQA